MMPDLLEVGQAQLGAQVGATSIDTMHEIIALHVELSRACANE